MAHITIPSEHVGDVMHGGDGSVTVTLAEDCERRRYSVEGVESDE